MKPTIDLPPIDAARCDAEWIAIRRKVISDFGFRLRAGDGRRIEIRSLTPADQLATHDRMKMNPWVPLILPDNASGFTTAADRDAVLQQLQQPLQ